MLRTWLVALPSCFERVAGQQADSWAAAACGACLAAHAIRCQARCCWSASWGLGSTVYVAETAVVAAVVSSLSTLEAQRR